MNKKTRLKAGFFFGISMAFLFIIQNFLFNNPQSTNEILKTVIIGIISGGISGLLFWWLIGLFANSKMVKESTKIETKPGETIIFETPANHFKGMEGVGGRLYLTNKRLVFKSHKWNIQNHLFEIDITDIKEIGRYKPLGIVNTGLTVTTEGNNVEKFVVDEVQTWIEKLGRGRP